MWLNSWNAATTQTTLPTDCVKDVYKQSKIEGDVIDRCMRDSGGLEKDTPNAFLDLEMYTQVASMPSLH